MFDIILIVLLLFGILRGLKRGFILQFFHLTGFIVAFIVANKYYISLSEKLTLWIPYPGVDADSFLYTLFQNINVEDVFYRAISFAILFFVVKILWKIIGGMIDFIASFPILKQLNAWAGAILGFIEIYLVLFLIMYFSILIPIAFIQDQLSHSSVAQWMIENTPYFSEKIKELWFEHAAS